MRINNYLLLLFVIISQIGMAQHIERKVLKGRIVADSIEVENLTVFNITSNIGAVTNADGKFSIKARATDTLYIQGISYESKKYVLTDKDFWLEELEIRLQVRINELDEVEITPYTLTGIVEEDIKRIQVYGDGFAKIDAKKVMHYEDDVRIGTPINAAMPSHFAPNGSNFNFLAIGAGIVSLFLKEDNSKRNSERVFEERRQRDIQSKSFSDHMFERFLHNFFVETLKIKHEDIPLFLQYAEMPVRDLSLFLKSEYEMQLIQYLTSKAKIFNSEKQNE
ncbi:carboxypeptidase-like regulatory domain-containing protein [Flavobacterium sp.]|uniref:carboxypeptidase-like regulatory domain-containing protein n=1 Tax=Flavobacterium sp. TaxID=239 RepID=UPI0035B4D975